MQECEAARRSQSTSFDRVWILTNQNSIAEEIKSRLRSGNACYHSVQNLLSSRLLSKNLKIKIYRTIILPIFLYGCETWLTLREERKLRVFENMMLRRISGPKRDEVTGEWRRLYNEELNDLHSSLNIVRVIKSKRMTWAGHVARMGEEYKSFSSSLCSLLHSPVTSSLLSPNILLITLSSNTLNFLSSRNVSDQVSHPYKTRGKTHS